MKKIVKGDTVLHNAVRFAKVARLLDIPVISSRQAKQGQICSELVATHGDKIELHQKSAFSMYAEAPIKARLSALQGRICAVVYGGETHVSVT